MAEYIVSSGVTSTGVIVSSHDSMYVLSAGTANSTTVNNYGSMFISSGGVANSTTVNYGGNMAISSGGVANSTIVHDSGWMYISHGGVANSTTINNGSMAISSGGVANSTTVSGWDASMTISSGGVANNTTVNSRGSMFISSGGVANSTTINKGSMAISGGGVANSTIVHDSGWMYISHGGVANSTTVNALGDMTISSGGVANSTTVNSGYMGLGSGGVANYTTVNSGGYIFISSGGSASTLTLKAGGNLGGFTYVEDQYWDTITDGVVIVSPNVTITENSMTISDGGVADSTTINGGSMYISSGGVANSTTVDYGSMTISNGGVANSTTVNDWGDMTISSGGVANNTTVSGWNASMYISSGGVANNTTVNSNGRMYISSGGVANNTAVSGWNASMTISSGGVANNTIVDSRGSMFISDGGVANSTNINGEGSMIISDGGVANSTTVNSGGHMTIYNGGYAKDVIIVSVDDSRHSGLKLSPGGVVENLSACSGFAIAGFTMNQAQVLNRVDDDGIHGTINNAIISGRDIAIVGSNLTVNSITMISRCSMTIFNGGVANSTTINYRCIMTISSGGVVNKTIVNSGGSMRLSRGIANNTVVSSGGRVVATGEANGTTVQSGGYISIYDSASSLTIKAGGMLGGFSFSEDRYWDKIERGNVIVADNVTIHGTFMYISSSGVANSTTVNGGGHMYISNEGVANSTIISGDYTSMTISSGGVHSGRLQIVSGGTVSAYAGAIIDFTVAEQEDASVALINDWSLISGGAGADYTLTVESNQASGIYALADGAADFANTISVKTADGTELGDLSVGSALSDGRSHRSYALSLNESLLTLTVAEIPVATETGTIAVDPDTGIAAATWDGTTTYSAGKIYAGNSDANNTVLLIDNVGATGANKTYAFGEASGADMAGEADIRLYQGEIGAIMGGAQDANHSVGAVDIQLGGGTTSASTTVVYGGGFGSVDEGIKITTSANTVVNGQVYGGPMITSGLSVEVGGDITLDLKGGDLKGDVTGGARVQTDTIGTTIVAGSASIVIDGADFTGGAGRCIYGAGWVFGKGTAAKRSTGADYSIGGVEITINSDVELGTEKGRGIFGGALAADYSIAQVDGNVSISINDATVTNIYGGGWAQSGAESNVNGNVSITLTNAVADVIYGGGAHGKTLSDIGTTKVDGNVSIVVTDSAVDAIYAVGQLEDDIVTGTASVKLAGASIVGSVYGAESTSLMLDDFTGTIDRELSGFDTVFVDGDTEATFDGGAEIRGSSWDFDLTDRTVSAESAVIQWESGAFGEAVFMLELGDTATAWTVCDLSGDDVKSEAFEEVSFQLSVGGNTFDYALGDEISGTGTAWDGATLDYGDETGILKFTLA